jgi:hypothetical protein
MSSKATDIDHGCQLEKRNPQQKPLKKEKSLKSSFYAIDLYLLRKRMVFLHCPKNQMVQISTHYMNVFSMYLEKVHSIRLLFWDSVGQKT